jgi:DNA modification methylase
MKKLEWQECDIVEVDVDDLTATALGIALNRSGELAAWDEPALAKLLEELKSNDALDGIGYSAEDLDKLVSELGGIGGYPEDEDDVPQPPEEATTRTGDLWVLDSHRLLVGDSASAQDVDRLLAGATIHLLNMDPPYNVRVEPRSNNAIAAGLSSFPGTHHHQALDLARHPEKAKPTERRLRAKDRPLENDFVSDEEFTRLLDAWFGNAARVLEPGGSFYIWGGYANCGNYPPALKTAGLYFSQAIIWVKEHPVLTRKDFMGNHEWCQPGDTKVATPEGPVRIASLRDGDRVVSYCSECDGLTGLKHGVPVRATSRQYRGDILGVEVGRQTTWCTTDHLWTVRLSASPKNGPPFLARGSDLLPDAMLVPVPGSSHDARWEPIRAIDLQPFSGDVYSLEVESFGHYVADGIVTHNCFYGWREGAGHEYLGPANATDVWSVKKVNPQSMVHLCLHPEAAVLTERGYRPIHSIEVGDRVLSGDGTFHAVTNVSSHPYTSEHLYRITAKGGNAATDASDNHPFLIWRPTRRRAAILGGEVGWVRADEVKPGDYTLTPVLSDSGPDPFPELDERGQLATQGSPTRMEYAGHDYSLRYVKKVEQIRYEGNVWNLSVEGHPSFQTAVGLSHNTEKPVELARRAILYSSRSGENVLDLFGGSGSTLIACEETERKAYLMEIDCPYADVILNRWEKFAGKEAVLDGTGKTFREVAIERREERVNEPGASEAEHEGDHEEQQPH